MYMDTDLQRFVNIEITLQITTKWVDILPHEYACKQKYFIWIPSFFEFINENLFISLLTVGSSRWNNPQWVIYLMNFASLFSAAHELPQIYEF